MAGNRTAVAASFETAHEVATGAHTAPPRGVGTRAGAFSAFRAAIAAKTAADGR